LLSPFRADIADGVIVVSHEVRRYHLRQDGPIFKRRNAATATTPAPSRHRRTLFASCVRAKRVAGMIDAKQTLRIVERSARLLTASPAGGLHALRQQAWQPATAPFPLHTVATLVSALPAIALQVADTLADAVLAPELGRVLLNVILLAAEALPAGGSIDVAGDAADLFIRITGPGAAWPSGYAAMLHDSEAALAALTTEHGWQAGLTTLLAMEADLRLSMVMPPMRGAAPPMLHLRAENSPVL